MPKQYPATCDPACYDLASDFLEDEPGLFNHDNCNELAGLIQKTIEDHIAWKRDNLTPETT